MNLFNALNAVIWHNWMLYAVLGTGVLFTFWSGFCQYRALTHGVAITRGKYDNPDDPGAISHFQALSAALSATVGLGNIGGVALAISLGGPGAVFWMWIVGLCGMAVKLTEVTLTMLYRNTDDPENPHGGPMMVVDQGVPARWPKLRPAGKVFAVIFSISVVISAITGGNLFQAWNVGDVTESYFGVPAWMCGLTLAVAAGLVIIGGIRRIGQVASRLVPFMVVLYFLGCIAVLGLSYEQIPESFALIFRGAFSSLEGVGAFIGGTAGSAFIFGMKRALFSSEAGQGSSPIAHSAARTDEPVREGIVAALEPFIDTLVVCTLTALVILSTGQWKRGPEAELAAGAEVVAAGAAGSWTIGENAAPARTGGDWAGGESVFAVVVADYNPETDNGLHKISGDIELAGDGSAVIRWQSIDSATAPILRDSGLYVSYEGATMTARALDSAIPGLGKWLVSLAVWLFAFSTIISWSYYAEQAVWFLGARKTGLLVYKICYCLLALVATLGWLRTDADLDTVTTLGTGLMLVVNMPIMWLFGWQAMRAYKEYIRRFTSGRMDRGEGAPTLESLVRRSPGARRA